MDKSDDHSPEKHPNLFYGAPTVIVVSHRKQKVQPGIEWANVTSVVNQMHLAATDLGLGSVYMWGALECRLSYERVGSARTEASAVLIYS